MIFHADIAPAARAEVYARQSQGSWTAPPMPKAEVERLSEHMHGPRVTTDGRHATVHLVGPLDRFFGFSPRHMAEALDRIEPDRITLAVASPGGYVEEAFQVYVDLRRRAEHGVTVDSTASGMVASAAVIAYLSGDKRSAPVGSSFMAHSAHVFVHGSVTPAFIKQIGDIIDLVNEGMASVFAAAGVRRASYTGWFDGDDHFMSPLEAHAARLVTQPVARSEGASAAGVRAAQDTSDWLREYVGAG